MWGCAKDRGSSFENVYQLSSVNDLFSILFFTYVSVLPRYGDEAHLDTTVKALGLVLPQKAYPQLKCVLVVSFVDSNCYCGVSPNFQV